MEKYMKVPLSQKDIVNLHSGDYVYLTGTIYTARDAAHKRLFDSMNNGNEIPIPLENNIIYYMGPSPARDGKPVGSAGPTTSLSLIHISYRLRPLWICVSGH